MRAPRFGEPTRVAFVGQESSYGRHALHHAAGDVLPRFFDYVEAAGHDAAELASSLHAWAPHVVVTFRSGTATLALHGDEDDPKRTIAPNADAPAWRNCALPVDDRLYRPVRTAARAPRAVFVGTSTAHRERYLIGAKHAYDVLHYANGLHGAELEDVLSRTDIGINLRDDLRPGFEHRTLVHLAAGHLLISEPLTPTHGLEPGIDFVEIERPDELMTALYQLQARPDTYERVRLRGREKAETYRASRVWPRLIGDLLADVAVFG